MCRRGADGQVGELASFSRALDAPMHLAARAWTRWRFAGVDLLPEPVGEGAVPFAVVLVGEMGRSC